MDRHYLLPVSAVVETMRSLSQVVMLQAHLASLPGVSKDACLALLTLGQGRIVSCLITSARTGTVLLHQQEAYTALEQCGDLSWSVQPVPAGVSSVGSIGGSASRMEKLRSPPSGVPALRVMLTPALLPTVALPYRRVLALVDGKRSVEEIAALLNVSPQEIEQRLAVLEPLVGFYIDTDQ